MPENTLPEIELPPPFPEYEIEGVGTVIAHEGNNYIVRTEDGRVIGFPAQTTPSEENSAADWTAWQNRPPAPAPVPASVTRRQLLLELNARGITRTAIRSQLGNDEAALIEFDEASEFARAHPLVASLATALGLTEAQVDDVFRAAANR